MKVLLYCSFQLLLFTAIACFFSSCNYQKAGPVFLPDEIGSSVTDSFYINSENVHYGHIEIADGVAVIQAFDKDTRKNGRILVFDLNKKKDYGNFPWPDHSDGWYFGIAPYGDSLLYFDNYQYLRKINLGTHTVDTVPLRSKISELLRMVVVGSKAYSLENIYGISIVDINNTHNQIFIPPYKGYYYNEQNSISIPVQSDLNLIASAETTKDHYTLYAIDSSLVIKWSTTFLLQNHSIRISSLRTSLGFLVKYDNHLVLLDSISGSTIWQKDFDLNILKHVLIDNYNLLLFVSSIRTEAPLGEPNELKKIINFDLRHKKENWSIANLGTSTGRGFFILDKFLFSLIEKDSCLKIDLNTGKQIKFLLPYNGTDIITDSKTGKNYIVHDNRFYW